MRKKINPIGVIGGISPTATAAFYQTVTNRVAKVTGGKLPEIFIHSVSIDSQIESAFISSVAKKDNVEFKKMQRVLEKSTEFFCEQGLDAIAMPCNTLQPILERICQEKNIYNINIPLETTKQVLKKGLKKILLLASMTTCSNGAYHLLNNYGVECIYPSVTYQDIISSHILHTLHSPYSKSPYIDQIKSYLSLTIKKVDGIVLACTDLAPLLEIIEPTDKIPVVDSLNVLINSSVKYICQGYEDYRNVPQ